MGEAAKVGLFIGGTWRDASSGATFDLIDPAREEVVGTAALADAGDTNAAIEAAEAGFAVWRKTGPWERAKVLRRVAGLLGERGEAVARSLAVACGKPLAQARGEVAGAVETIDWYADEARRIYGEVLQGRAPGQRFVVTHEPVGVVAAFTAWNFPVALVARKLAPALAAGCSIVVRPAEEGCEAVAMLVQCCVDAGVPDGVVNLLTGKPEPVADAVMASDLVRKVTFTGSVPVGQHLMRRAADTMKRVSMELGGHAPVIVWDDVDVAKAAKAAAAAKLRNNGQVCVSPTRFFVQEGIKDGFVDALAEAVKGMKLGHPLDEGTEVGPLINRRRLEAVDGMVRDTVAEGARIVTGGGRPAGMNRGYYFEPTVLDGVEDGMRVMRDEPFGPIAPMTSFKSLDEVIERANALPVGLAGYVLTGDMARAEATAAGLKVGMVGVNTYAVATAEMPFGGVKHSGFGRENGRQGILDYLDVKFTNWTMG